MVTVQQRQTDKTQTKYPPHRPPPRLYFLMSDSVRDDRAFEVRRRSTVDCVAHAAEILKSNPFTIIVIIKLLMMMIVMARPTVTVLEQSTH